MNYISHTVVHGDKIQYLAQRYLGDAARWIEIATYNNLDYPFIVYEKRTKDTPKNVRAIGDVIRIPVEEELIDTLPPYELHERYTQALGTDLSVFPDDKWNYDLVKGRQAELLEGEDGDLKIVRGIHNYKQAITLRLMTPQGSLLHHPEYGSRLGEYLGIRDTEENQHKIRIELERVIRSDPRTENVVINDFELDHDRIRASLSISVIGIDEVIRTGFTISREGEVVWD